MLDSAQLIFDLQKVNTTSKRISGCLDTTAITQEITEALIHDFHCVFARIWLTEPDGASLKLVASSGLHTSTNGSFARVPMGAYKVGKIAQSCIPFLSNHLANETWVKDRDWAIANNIRGFAGYPLVGHDRVIGVLAVFSDAPFVAEFLEVLQVLCMAVAIAIDAVRQLQSETNTINTTQFLGDQIPLPDVLARLLSQTKLTLIGTEKKLSPTLAYLLIRTTEKFNQLSCNYCRLIYGETSVTIEAIVETSLPEASNTDGRSPFKEIEFLAHHIGGEFRSQSSINKSILQISLQLPYDGFQNIKLNKHLLSEREKEIISLLAQGLRDRDIAEELHISESTVKFHLNGTLHKLNAKNRYQAIYQATVQGFI